MKAILYTAATRPDWRTRAARGGAMGEIVASDSLAFGLRRLGYEVVEIGSLRQFARHFLSAWRHRRRSAGESPLPPSRGLRRRLDYVFFDPVTFELACRYRLLRRGLGHLCLVLEPFGTSPGRVSGRAPWLDTRRYLTPFPDDHGWNTFLGVLPFREDDQPPTDPPALRARIAGRLGGKKRQGVIWAKEARYLQGEAGRLVEWLSSVCTLHATLAPENGVRPGRLPAGVVNHGCLAPARFRELLAESSFLIGLGDPIAGCSPIEALAAGCVYINPRFSPVRYVNGERDLPVSSQSPWAEKIGPPFVQTVDLQDHEAVLRAAHTSFDGVALRAALDGTKGSQALVEAVWDYFEPAYLDRLRGILQSFR
jgi:hypothetical protein